jgi:homoserine O-acetyltransferase
MQATAKIQTIQFNEPLALQSGEELSDYQITYATYGELNEQHSNAILICHALSSNHLVAGEDEHGNTGWWDIMVGPGKPIDTDHLFVVCPNNIGGCNGSTGPSSVDPSTGQPYGPDFPIITVADWVNTQAKLADALGIQTWAAVIGGSLGGMQAMQWSMHYPDRLKHAALIATAAKLTAQNIGFNDVARQAIRTDPDFHDGRYYQHDCAPERGLRIARMLGHITYLSDDLMAEKFGRNLQSKETLDYEYNPEFAVESYLRYQGDRFVKTFDANTYLLMTKALDYFDPASQHSNSLAESFSKSLCDFLVISFTSDWRFSPQRSEEITRALQQNNLNVSYLEVKASQGHDSFLLDIPQYLDAMRAYMKRVISQTAA